MSLSVGSLSAQTSQVATADALVSSKSTMVKLPGSEPRSLHRECSSKRARPGILNSHTPKNTTQTMSRIGTKPRPIHTTKEKPADRGTMSRNIKEV